MNVIKSLEELITTLNTSTPQSFVRIAKRMDLPLSAFEPYAHWKPGGYTRNCIERTAVYELLLLCWESGDTTPIHGHNEQRCWVHQVDGKLKETRYHLNKNGVLEACHIEVLTPGCLSYMQDEMGYHSLTNNTHSRAMTLHLYMSPIDSCKTYDPSKNSFHTTHLQYDSYKGVLTETYSSSR